MEVHAHSHTPRKKWTHYLWEFLMLFLAVFCGFLAENQREHMMEHRRAKSYAINLYKELKEDTGYLKGLMGWDLDLSKRFDTLCALSLQYPGSTTTGMLYYYSGFTSWMVSFESRASTYDQMKSSGNLRIISHELAFQLSNYDRLLRNLQNDYNLSKVEYETINGLRMKIFDGYLTEILFPNGLRAVNRDSAFKLNPPLVNDDPKLMKEFIGWIKAESRYTKGIINDWLEPLKKNADSILHLLKKDYHLKD